MSFQLSPELDKNKVFITNRSDLFGRLDPFYYISELVDLDEKIKSKTNYRLRDFSIFRASGATPSKNKNDLYSDKENGVPFIRVQNLSVTGELDQKDLVFISRNTHETLLKRSKIQEHDLLVKITGVGRMAVASVAPDNFEGNINQHIVVIRTGSKEISENIATFLNLDMVERIASKRSTGGTRPALDYPALFSIPVMNNRAIYNEIQKAISAKKQKETEAHQILGGIDDYLLDELGIELPVQEESTLQSRMFKRQLSEVSGGRFDSPIHQKKCVFESTKYPMRKFNQCVFINPLTSFYGHTPETLATFIPMEKVSDIYGEADISNNRTIEESAGYTKFQDNDLIWAKITPCMQNGKLAVVTDLNNKIGFGSTEFHVFRAKQEINIQYIYGLLRLRSLRKYAVLYFSGSAGHQRVSDEFFKRLSIPHPPIKKQTEIANHIFEIRKQAKQLQHQAIDELDRAKKEVETMILGADAR